MKRAGFATLCLALAACFAALGVWQVERRAWKLDLIAKVEARVHAAPSALPTGWNADLAYRRVRVFGRLFNDRETYVQAVTEHGPGWWVMTPLRLRSHGREPHPRNGLAAAGSRIDSAAPQTILINRGFVPSDHRDARSRTNPASDTTITGLVRTTEPGGGFLRSNDPAADRWYSRDVAAIARKRGLPPVAPFFIDADATPNPGGYPIGGLTVVAFRNNHLMYAITWFGLAALCIAGAAMILRTKRSA